MFLAAAVLTAAVWTTVGSSIQNAQHPFNLGRQTRIAHSAAAVKNSITEDILNASPASTTALVTIHVNRVSLAGPSLEATGPSLEATVFLNVPLAAMQMLVDRQTEKAINPTTFPIDFGTLDVEVIIATANNPPITLRQSISSFYYEASSPNIPKAGLYGIVGSVVLGVTGVAHAFPQDSYDSIIVVSGPYLPDRLGYEAGPGNLLHVVPSIYQVTQDPDVNAYTITDSIFTSGQTLVAVNRTTNLQLFTYAVGFMPVLLAVVLLHLIWTRELDIVDTLKLLFAALFTILPLRVVLVPSDIGGLTLLDDLLGAEVMLLLMVGAIAYWRDAWQRSRKSARTRQTLAAVREDDAQKEFRVAALPKRSAVITEVKRTRRQPTSTPYGKAEINHIATALDEPAAGSAEVIRNAADSPSANDGSHVEGETANIEQWASPPDPLNLPS